jgi:hypothetical protein
VNGYPGVVWVGSMVPSPDGPAFTESNPGYFEDVRFYHRAMTTAEILSLAQCR